MSDESKDGDTIETDDFDLHKKGHGSGGGDSEPGANDDAEAEDFELHKKGHGSGGGDS